MSGHLEHEAAVAPFKEQLVARRAPERQATEDEWSGIETDILPAFRALAPHEFNPVCLPQSILRDQQIAVALGEQIAYALHGITPPPGSHRGHTTAIRSRFAAYELNPDEPRCNNLD